MMLDVYVRKHPSMFELIIEMVFQAYEKPCTKRRISSKPECGPKLVCTQFWSETSSIFLASCTLRISSCEAYHEGIIISTISKIMFWIVN